MSITNQREDRDAYSMGISNEERNASGFARITILLFVLGGLGLTLLQGFTS